ncbi:discoidin domain-containing protein, partial [Neobacillus sp. MM2021_6]|uniref:discoidin domain-containing protein n=1 Tax=Bacillaceae TaxID=186817 RepID=UPI00140E11BE
GVFPTVKNVKIEKGNKSTDWTPAPEDVSAETAKAVFEAKAEIKLTTDGISQNVSSLTNTVTSQGTRLSTAESSISSQAEQIESKVSLNDLNSYASKVKKVRYIRDWIKGSSANTGNHWVEIKAMSGTTNRALNKDVTLSPNSTVGNNSLAIIVNNDINSNNYMGSSPSGALAWVQIDLGAVYEDIDFIQVWHYYNDGRTYHNTKVEISEDGITWTTLFDSSITGEYKETANGLVVQVNNS